MMPLTPLPPDRNIAAAMLATPLWVLLAVPGIQSYRLVSKRKPWPGVIATVRPSDKTGDWMLGWRIAECVLRSPAVLGILSLLATAMAWQASLSVSALRGFILSVFLLIAGMIEPIFAPLPIGDNGTWVAVGRIARIERQCPVMRSIRCTVA